MEEITSKELEKIFNKRKEDSHKGEFGYVGIMGGCREYSGAVKLANLSCASLRAGCGVTRVIVPEKIADYVAPYLLEQTLFTIKDDENYHMKFDAEQIKQSLSKLKALAIGMGWGEGPDNAKILQFILETQEISIIIDADGLNTLAKMDKNILKATKCKVVLTPHLKEFERISGYSIEEIKKNKETIAKKFAIEYGIILLLKGHTTIVTDGEESYAVKRGGPGMSTAGSGDVLSGILVGVLGYQEPTPLAVACGAYLAGMAGELAEKQNTDIAMIASDTVKQIPNALKEIRCFL